MGEQNPYSMQNNPYSQQLPPQHQGYPPMQNGFPQQNGWGTMPQGFPNQGGYAPNFQQGGTYQQPIQTQAMVSQPYQQAAPQQPQQEIPAEKPKEKVDFGETLSRIFVGTLTTFIIVYMGWLFAPSIRNSLTFWPTNTPTPVTPTPTLPATATVTPLATNTPTPAPTATPGPISTYWVQDGNTLDPAVPNAPEGLVILSAINSAEVEPAFDSIYWTSSKEIISDLGMMNTLYDSEWFATLNNGSVRFFMDQSLNEGLYEIYVMDTYYSSGGSLDYVVKLGDQSLQPLTGTQTVSFMTSQYEPRQSMDTWRSLGIYYVMQSRDILTVSTQWGMRDQYSYVAADRVMIVPRKMTDLSLLNKLPSTGTKYIMDQTQATFSNTGTSMFTESSSIAWDDSYQLIVNPKDDITIEYSNKEPLPIGKYALYMYFPESKGGLDVKASFYTDGTQHYSDNDEEEIMIHVPTGGNWSLIGNFTTDRFYERPVKIKVKFTVAGEQQGEFPVNAIALIHTPFADSISNEDWN